MSTAPPQQLEEERIESLTKFTTLLGYYTLGNSHGLSNSSTPPGQRPVPVPQQDATKTATAVATELTKKECGENGVGAGGAFDVDIASAGRTNKSACEISEYLYKDDDDPIGGAICSLPSMEVQISEAQQSGCFDNNPSPPPPVTHILGHDDGTTAISQYPHHVPAVPPSVAIQGIQPQTSPTAAVSAIPNKATVVPSSPPKPTSDTTTTTTTNEAEDQTLASSLTTPTIWTRSSIAQAPPAILRSFASSFSSLVDTRVRAWTLFLLRRSLSAGENSSRSHLLNLLAARSSIEVNAVVTMFRVLEGEGIPLKKEEKEEGGREGGGGKRRKKERKYDLVRPIRFEAVMDISLQGRQLTVRFSIPGTIAANYQKDTSLISHTECKLDTKELINSMVEQARRVVFEAIAAATSPSQPHKPPNSSNNNMFARQAMSPPPIPTTSFSQFNKGTTTVESNNLASRGRNVSFSDTDQNMMRTTKKHAKAAKSALVLSSLLTSPIDFNKTEQNKDDNQNLPKLGTKKKQPSVVWKNDEDMATRAKSCNGNGTWSASLFKRRKLANDQPKMKRSMKSFGKPNANTFNSVRNATFAEFGCLDDRNKGGMNRLPNALQNAFELRRSGDSNRAIAKGINGSSRNGGFGPVSSMNQVNATFEKAMTSSLSGSMSDRRVEFQGRQHPQQSNGFGQKLPTGELGALSLSSLRSSKSGQFERMLSIIQSQGNLDKDLLKRKIEKQMERNTDGVD